MALNSKELASVRRTLAATRSNPATAQESISGVVIDAASQAIYARLTASKTVLNSDIEAIAPDVFTTAQKKVIFAHTSVLWARNEGAN